MPRNNVICDQCKKNIEEDTSVYFSDTEKHLDFCSENCYSEWSSEGNWENIHQDFTFKLKKQWSDKGFSYAECKEWISIGFEPIDYGLVAYIRDVIGYNTEHVLNNNNREELNLQYQCYLKMWKGVSIFQSEKEGTLEKTNPHPNWKEYGNPFLDFTEEITQIWIELGLSKECCQEWLNIGLKSEDMLYAYWLENVKRKTPEWVSNYDDKTGLHEEFMGWFKALRRENVSTQWLNENYPKEYRTIIKRLDITEKNLEGNLDLSDFVNLEELYCNKNAFSHLDITKCNNLRILNCSNNQLAELDVSNLTKLSILECWNNQIKSLNVENCLQLSYLDCNNNLITDLNISNLPIINSVNCYANKLTNFQVNNCPQLECLYFSNNLLINFDFTSLNPEKVTTLHLGNNKFAEQDLSCFSQFAKLVSLSIGDNCFVGSLEPLKKCTKLRVLEFVNNDINGVLEHLPHSIEAICCSTKEETKEEVKEIEQLLRESDNFMLIDNAEGHGKLYIRKEEWKTIDSNFTPELQKDWERCGFDYAQTKAWIDADLKANDFVFAFYLKEYQSCTPEKMMNYYKEDKEDIYKLRKGALKLIKSLGDFTENAQAWLDKEYPKNGTCLGEFDKINEGKKREEIKELNITWEILGEKKLEGNLKLEGFINLEKLDCSGNSIADLDLNDCTELRELKCLSNQLTKLDLNNCPSLIQLWCSDNHFASLDVNKYTNLLALDCGNNQLTSLDISKLINLRALECPDNLLTSLDLSNCRKLLYLNCSENKLANLDVSSLVKLEHLCCSYNKLKHLKFGESSSLKELKCSGNLLNSTKFTSTLEKLYVSENDFPKQDLFIFSKFINLRILNLENNHFHGSLKFLEKLDELQELYIDNTDIDEGVEFLPDSLEYFSFSGCSKIEEADKKNGGKYSRKNERKQAVKNATSLILNHVFSEESKSKPEAIPSEELEKIINEKTNIKGKIIDKQFFSTWFNPNCAIIISEVYSGYAVRLVIYEPPLEKIKESLFVKKFPKNPLKWYSLEKAQKKTELIKEKLNSDNPILAVAKKSSSLDNVIQKSTLPYNIDPKEHLRPLDIVWRKMDDGINYHAAIYLGDNQVMGSIQVAHISFLKVGEEKDKKNNILRTITNTVNAKKNFWARIDTWEKFLKETNDNLIKHHFVIPFKKMRKVINHISKAIFHQHGRGLYDLLSNNCEHFATLCVCGIPFSEQADRFKFLFSTDLAEEFRKNDEMFEKEMISTQSLFWELQFGSTISDFKDNPELIKEWTKAGFINEQIREWLDFGLKIEEYECARWLRDIEQLNPKNENDKKILKEKIEEYKKNISSLINIETKNLTTKLKNLLLMPSETKISKKNRLVKEIIRDIYQVANKEIPTDLQKNNQVSHWQNISSDFTPQLIQSWTNHNFTPQQTQDWLNIGLRPTDVNFVAWLREIKHLVPEQVLNHHNLEQLSQEFSNWQQEQQQANIEIPPR